MKFSAATNWDNVLVETYSELSSRYDNKIIEVFGSSSTSLLGSANAGLPLISPEKIQKHIQISSSAGLKFNYLINSANVPLLTDSGNKARAMDTLKWLSDIGVDILTVACDELLHFISEHFQHFPLNVSIVRGIKSISEAEMLRRKFPSIRRITLHQTLNRDRAMLSSHLEEAHKTQAPNSLPVEVELLANEICLYDCPRMKEHYIALSRCSQGDREVSFDWNSCARQRRLDVLEFLNSCWIRPEDVCLYDDLGVNYLKLAGRKESTANLVARAEAYLRAKYEGNVMDLFLAEFWPDSKPPRIKNRTLDNFLQFLWSRGLTRADALQHLGEYGAIRYEE